MMASLFRTSAGKAVGGVAIIGVGYQTYHSLTTPTRSEHVVIVGGGSAGVGIASMLQRKGLKNVTVIEPKSTHYYQPLWSLVGGGVKKVEKSARPMKSILPSQAKWIQKRVESFSPEKNQVTTDDGSNVDYDYLIVASGLQIDWEKIPGALEGLQNENSNVVSIYDYRFAGKTSKVFDNLQKKMKDATSLLNFVFTMAPMPIKCAGAPQKIMWLMDDVLRGLGLRDKAHFAFWTPSGAMFGVKKYSDKLEKIRQERGVDGQFKRLLVSVDSSKNVATFKNVDTDELITESFDLLHVVPPMSAPDFIKKSPLADKNGWVDVDKHTLQSAKYSNVFALGDCTNTPNSKTAAAITAQAPVLVHNLLQRMDDKKMTGHYNGYASCPLIIGKGKVMLAEFGYGGKIMETFDRETGKFPLNMVGTDGVMQQRFFYFLKEQMFPFVYWILWTRGMWYGTNGPFQPSVELKDEQSSSKSKVSN